MLYLTRQMVALKPLTYGGQELRPGDVFAATEVDAGYFAKHKRAANHEAEIQAPMIEPVAESVAPEPKLPDNPPTRRRPGRPRKVEAQTPE